MLYRLAAALLALAGLVTPALGQEARPLAAWLDFCRRHPAECAVDLAEPARIRLTPALRRTIASVNRTVNGRFRHVPDDAAVVDSWDFPVEHGDCEDLQLEKRRRLRALGLPHRALRMAVVLDEKGEGHAVLLARTDRGDLVLDNQTNRILPLGETGYTFIKREGENGPGWVAMR